MPRSARKKLYEGRVVCDTNIFISALIFPGESPDEVVNLARMGQINLYTSPFILNEFERVLKEKFGHSESEAKERSQRITNISAIVDPFEKLSVIKEDESDNRILECAVIAKVDFIISGDRHLQALKEFGSIKIVSASEFLKLHRK